MSELPDISPPPEPAQRPRSLAQLLRYALADEQRFWQLATALFCTFAVLKGLRAPGLWPLTQAEIDYSHGFIKRGLQGELLTLLHIHRFHPLSAFFLVQLGVLFALLAELTRRVRTEARFGSLLPVAIFASSYAITYLTHIVGYTDIALGTLALVLLLIPTPRARFVAALVLVPIALLIHESFLLMFLPVVLFSFALEGMLQSTVTEPVSVKPPTPGSLWTRPWPFPFLFAAILALLAFVLTLAFSIHANLSAAEIARFKHEIAGRVDFELRDDFFNVLSRPLSGSVKEALDGFTYPDWFVPDLVSLANLLPPVLLLLHLTRRLVRATLPHRPRTRRWLWIAAALAICSPLAMFLLGVDGGRWNTDATLMLYLVLLLLCRALPAGGITLTTAERNAAILVLAINMASGMGLFDGESIHPYPFVPAVSEDYR